MVNINKNYFIIITMMIADSLYGGSCLSKDTTANINTKFNVINSKVTNIEEEVKKLGLVHVEKFNNVEQTIAKLAPHSVLAAIEGKVSSLEKKFENKVETLEKVLQKFQTAFELFDSLEGTIKTVTSNPLVQGGEKIAETLLPPQISVPLKLAVTGAEKVDSIEKTLENFNKNMIKMLELMEKNKIQSTIVQSNQNSTPQQKTNEQKIESTNQTKKEIK